MSNFALYLKNLIDNKKLKPSQVATYTGASPGAVSLWLSGQRIPKPEYLKKLAPVLNITTEELMRKIGYLDEEKPDIKSHRRYLEVTGLKENDIEMVQQMIDCIRDKYKKEKEAQKKSTIK